MVDHEVGLVMDVSTGEKMSWLDWRPGLGIDERRESSSLWSLE